VAGRRRAVAHRPGYNGWYNRSLREVQVTQVGLVCGPAFPALDRKGLPSGFVPQKVAGDLDFISVHRDPKQGLVDEALRTLAGPAVGRTVPVEETVPLACSPQRLEEFIGGSQQHAAGWIGFYWGKTPDELRRTKTISDALTLNWLEFFEKKAKAMGK
jgi:hypothetical protein